MKTPFSLQLEPETLEINLCYVALVRRDIVDMIEPGYYYKYYKPIVYQGQGNVTT